jgi:hypothetical protein
MKNVYLTFFAVVSLCLAGPFVRAGDYFLAEGETDTISTNAVYETMTVAGDLDVYVPGGTSSASKRVNFTSTLNLLGARLTLDSNGGSKYFRMGYGGFNDDPKVVVNLTNNTAGAYAQIVVRDMNAATDLGLLCEKLYLRKEAEGTAPKRHP